jgi:hypothetical protein
MILTVLNLVQVGHLVLTVLTVRQVRQVRRLTRAQLQPSVVEITTSPVLK